MRLSDSDRELLYEQLKRHAAAGRLSVEELERRVAAVAMAESQETAAQALSDLPPLPGSVSAGERRRSLLNRRGHAETDAPAPDWTPTAERFRDPSSGKVMRVWVDSGGARHYVPDGN